MGDIDFYGYERANAGQYLLSSDYAAIYFANTAGGASVSASRAGLVQSAGVSYQHAVQPRFEAGSHELYWLTGQAQGAVQIGRLISDKGILDGVRHGRGTNDIRKGVLGGVEFKIGRLGLQGISIKQEVLILSGCVLQQYSVSFSVGGLEVAEGMSIQCAMLKRGLRA